MKPVIRDNRELLVDVRKFLPGARIFLDRERMERERTAYLREGVARRLRAAQKLLPPGVNFVIRDAWRPAYVQCSIYYDFLAKATARFPGLSPSERLKRINVMVAPWRGPDASGHMTGGAMDIRLLGADGRRLPMVSYALSYTDNARSDQTNLPLAVRKNRALLREVMSAVGFSNHPGEYWHWSYGDWHWAKREGRHLAIYGIVPSKKGLYAGAPCPCGARDSAGHRGAPFEKCHGRH